MYIFNHAFSFINTCKERSSIMFYQVQNDHKMTNQTYNHYQIHLLSLRSLNPLIPTRTSLLCYLYFWATLAEELEESKPLYHFSCNDMYIILLCSLNRNKFTFIIFKISFSILLVKSAFSNLPTEIKFLNYLGIHLNLLKCTPNICQTLEKSLFVCKNELVSHTNIKHSIINYSTHKGSQWLSNWITHQG